MPEEFLLLGAEGSQRQLLLGGEVEIERALGQPAGADNVVERDALKAASGERRGGGLNNLLAGALGAGLRPPGGGTRPLKHTDRLVSISPTGPGTSSSAWPER
jgi:hypothetical protein